ncbi:MAG: winged helix-turn-helix domain-containing protein [Rhodoluna sp.]
MPEQLSLNDARLLVVHAQGLDSKPSKDAKSDGPLALFDRLSLLQLDSVNVFERAHYMPVFSRLGAYDKSVLDDASRPLTETGKQAELIEYWAHEAAWIKTEDLPLHRFRMDWYRYGTDDRRYGKRGWAHVVKEHGPLMDWIREELRSRGPLTIAQIEHDQNKRKGNWWGWSDVKTCLERMFLVGEVVSAGRDKFSRRYALVDQVLTGETLARMLDPKPDYEQNLRTVIGRAAKAEGVATIKDLADFVRLTIDRVAPRVQELVELGELIEVSVEGFKEKAFLHREWQPLVGELPAPKHVTLLSPFDPLTRNRDRAIRLFDFDYKIEIYTPEPKRVYGYYTLPLLYRGNLVGRIDLKSDRKAGELLVQSAWHEPGLSAKATDSIALDLAKHLNEVTKWQGLSSMVIADKGNLAQQLRSASQSREVA